MIVVFPVFTSRNVKLTSAGEFAVNAKPYIPALLLRALAFTSHENINTVMDIINNKIFSFILV